MSKGVEQKSERKRCKWWNRGYCKFKQSCPYLHPKEICIEEQCLKKECEKRHPNICKNWQKGSCHFTNLCEFTHPSVVNQDEDCSVQKTSIVNQSKVDSEHKICDVTINDDNYVDYDNIDSDDDSEDDSEDENLKCQECNYTSKVKGNLTKHVKCKHGHTCDKCDFLTSNKMHLKMHIRACHKKNDENKKRKSTDDVIQSRKKTKKNVVSKKVKNVKC